jgi:hypothetical protein
MTFELCSCNEYGERSILGRSGDLQRLLKQAKQVINEENMDNALTLDEKMREWMYCLVEVVGSDGQVKDNLIYAGRTGNGRHIFFDTDTNKQLLFDQIDGELRFFVGEVRKSQKIAGDPLYAKDPSPRGKLVNNFSHQQLEGKTILYVAPK